MSKDEYSIMKKDFERMFETIIKPNITVCERIRIMIIMGFFLLIILLFILGFLYNNSNENSIFFKVIGMSKHDLTFYVNCIFLALPILYWYMFTNYYDSMLKVKVMPFISECFNNVIYWNKNISEEKKYFFDSIIRENNLIPYYEVFKVKKSHDYFTGKYKGLDYEILEASLEELPKKNKTIFFEGVLLYIALPKNFKGYTIINDVSSNKFWKGMGVHRFYLNTIDLEDHFNVYTSNETEAKKITSDEILKKFIEIKEKYSGKVQCVFYKNNIVFALSSGEMVRKNFFSVGGFLTTAKNIQKYTQIFEDIWTMLDVISMFSELKPYEENY